MEEMRDKDDEYITEEDKKTWFKKVYMAYMSKIVGAYDLANFLNQETVLPFSKLGLIPPLSVNETANKLEVKRKEEEIVALQVDITEYEKSIKLIMN